MQASLFGIRRKYDGLVRFQIPAGPALAAQVAEIMQAIPRTFAPVTRRSVPQEDLVYYTSTLQLARCAGARRRRSEVGAADQLRAHRRAELGPFLDFR